MDNEVFRILHKCNCLEHYPKFEGVSIAELRTLSPFELKFRLMMIIASAIADAIAHEITKSGVSSVSKSNVTTMDNGPSDVTTFENEPSDVTKMENDPIDVRTTENEPIDVRTTENEPSNVTTIENKRIDVTATENDQSNVTTIENKPSDVTATENKPSDVMTKENENEPSDVTATENEPSDVTTIENEPSDVTTMENGPRDITTMQNEPSDITTMENEPSDVTTFENEPSNATTVENELSGITTMQDEPSDVMTIEKEPSDVTTIENEPTDVTTVENGSSDVKTMENGPSDVTTVEKETCDVTTMEDEPTDVTKMEDEPSDVASENELSDVTSENEPSDDTSDNELSDVTSENEPRDVTSGNELSDVKPNVDDMVNRSPSSIVDDDDEPLIVHEVPGDGSDTTEGSVEEVTIDDDDETMSLEEDTYDGSSLSENPALPKKHRFVPSVSTLDRFDWPGPLNVHFSTRYMSSYNRPAKRRKVRLDSEPTDPEPEMVVDSAGMTAEGRARWNSLYDACGPDKIKFLECDGWQWGPLDGPSPKNLYRLLSRHCVNLSHLTFASNLTLTSKYPKLKYASSIFCDSTFSGPLTLPNLKVIRVQRFWQTFNFSSVLRDIIQATAGGLEVLEFSCGNGNSVRPLLQCLGSTSGPQCGLRGLKSLSILNHYPSDSFVLTNEDFKILGSLNCHDLREVTLDCAVAHDVQAPLEAFLKTVPKLTKFKLRGSFQSTEVRPPEVTLTFPVLKFLEELLLGPTEIEDSACDDLDSRPATRQRRQFLRHFLFEGQGQVGELTVAARFPVTVSLRVLPKLKQLQLGRFFEIDELHLRTLPNLTELRVSSSWQLAHRLSARNRTFPNIVSLQLPDQLEDDDFVRTVLPLFPNLKCLVVNLPTVKVIRAMSWAMKSVKSLVHLRLVTQFDFGSTLDTCFVDKPSEVVMSENEVKIVATLKAYKHWEQYVEFHGIELPSSGNQVPNSGFVLNSGNGVPNSGIMSNSGNVPNSEVCELDDESKYAGLSVLKKDNFVLDMRHVERRMRLPTGDLHWDHGACAFGDTLLGFERFPVSPTVENVSQVLDINFYGFRNKVFKRPDGFKWVGRTILWPDPCTTAYMGIRKGDATD